MAQVGNAQPKLDEYFLGKELGRGSFAKVYLAIHETTRESRAVKKIDRTRLSAKLLTNLESEISILRDFQHENIVKLYGIKKTREHIYLVLEFCSGGDLHKFIKTQGRLSEAVSQRFMRHLASGLVFLWQKQLIHRDIKPQNLLLSCQSPGATLKIADFGFARHLATAAMADTLCGSPLYMAPEILTFQRYDGKADLWSAGTVLFEMLVGRPPYGGANQAELIQNIRTKEIRLPQGVVLSAPCIALIRMLLQRNPQKRASYEMFVAAEFLRPLNLAAPSSQPPPPSATPRQEGSQQQQLPPSPPQGEKRSQHSPATTMPTPPLPPSPMLSSQSSSPGSSPMLGVSPAGNSPPPLNLAPTTTSQQQQQGARHDGRGRGRSSSEPHVMSIEQKQQCSFATRQQQPQQQQQQQHQPPAQFIQQGSTPLTARRKSSGERAYSPTSSESPGSASRPMVQASGDSGGDYEVYSSSPGSRTDSRSRSNSSSRSSSAFPSCMRVERGRRCGS
mmetsp:Transcript_60599/g.118780  ORF Transcript_60599/g.118780 Transcript_60599/m.118780 type:complete len:504 (-) Transcript_60599:187-1698(-)